MKTQMGLIIEMIGNTFSVKKDFDKEQTKTLKMMMKDNVVKEIKGGRGGLTTYELTPKGKAISELAI